MVFKGVRPGKVVSLCITAAAVVSSWIPVVNVDFPLRFLAPFARIPRTYIGSPSLRKMMSVFSLRFFFYFQIHIFTFNVAFVEHSCLLVQGCWKVKAEGVQVGIRSKLSTSFPGCKDWSDGTIELKTPVGAILFISVMLGWYKWAER